jgi:8-oxo-dGTP pyrophosphatase MutT (NUDIX family)
LAIAITSLKGASRSDLRTVEAAAPDLRSVLLDPAEAEAMDAHGGTEAAVLIPLYGWPQNPGLVFTERRSDLRSHAGEISFPGGRRDPGEELVETALREAEEEIGLTPDAVSIAGALPPVGTFVTSYKVHPFVGQIQERMSFRPNPAEVESVLLASLDDLAAGYAKRRLIRRGIPIKTDSYLVSDKLIWGATARMLGLLLERLRGADEFRALRRS